ncbi:MAG: plasmid mobilization relaxosome protein MobC [Treponema sp.]|nr:plasmid mobilization relaxosome protein MobC [Treponema sp.]
MNKSRPNKITFRLSDSELQDLRSRVEKSGFNEQQYLTRAVFSKTLIEKETLHQLLIELRRQGVNLNQIARACNSGNAPLETDRINQSITDLEELWQSLRQ